jgi:hypothetical protein
MAILAFARQGVTMSPKTRRAAVAAVQLLGAGFVLACWLAQSHISSQGATRVYFKPTTLVVAALLAAAVATSIALWGRSSMANGLARSSAWLRSGPANWVAASAALVATAVWVLPAVYSDVAVHAAPKEMIPNAFSFDESAAVVNGRTPLVDMVAYGSLWPYLIAIPLRAFGCTYAAFTITMATLTGAALLALFWTLVRVTRHAISALGLYLPILAMGFFLERGTSVAPYSPGTYYGMFPLRYAGPCLLALLTAFYLGKEIRRPMATVGLFAAAGIVLLNNLDFGGGALLGTLAAVILTRQTFGLRALLWLGGTVVLGLLLSLGVVTLVTLIRAGEPPHLELLARYGRIFVVGGNGNLRVPGLGLHLVITLTFIAALATAAVRAAAAERDLVLTGMLAWSGMFGLGAGVYYYAYRSHPDVLINLFAIWALTLALLVVVAVRAAVPGRPPRLPTLVVLFGFGLAACSLAQAPDPWAQARRIQGQREPGQTSHFPPGAFRAPGLRSILAAQTRPGERVLVLSPTGHRVAEDAGVVNVSPYPGLSQMPTREQLDEALDALRKEGGDKIFVLDTMSTALQAVMQRRGFPAPEIWQVDEWSSDFLVMYRCDSCGVNSRTGR